MKNVELSKLISESVLRFKIKIRKEDVTNYAKDFRLNPNSTFGRAEQVTKAIHKLNYRVNEIFIELLKDSEELAKRILGSDELFAQFSKKDRFNLTFSNKFQMAKKRTAKQVRDAFKKAEKEGLTVNECFERAREAWLKTSEIAKFIAYMVAHAFNFKLYVEIFEESESGKLEIVLNKNHKHKDVCDYRSGVHDIGDVNILPPFHPYCSCWIRKV